MKAICKQFGGVALGEFWRRFYWSREYLVDSRRHALLLVVSRFPEPQKGMFASQNA